MTTSSRSLRSVRSGADCMLTSFAAASATTASAPAARRAYASPASTRSPCRHAFISALVSLTIRSRPASGVSMPRITELMISRCARQMRTELPPG